MRVACGCDGGAESSRTAVLRVRVRDVLILARCCGRCWARQWPVELVRRLDVAEPAVDLLMPGEWPVLQLVLLRPALGAVDDGRCGASSTIGLAARSELSDRGGRDSVGSFFIVRRRTARGGGIGGGKAVHGARRRHRQKRRRKRRRWRRRRGQGRFAFVFNGNMVKVLFLLS